MSAPQAAPMQKARTVQAAARLHRHRGGGGEQRRQPRTSRARNDADFPALICVPQGGSASRLDACVGFSQTKVYTHDRMHLGSRSILDVGCGDKGAVRRSMSARSVASSLPHAKQGFAVGHQQGVGMPLPCSLRSLCDDHVVLCLRGKVNPRNVDPAQGLRRRVCAGGPSVFMAETAPAIIRLLHAFGIIYLPTLAT